MRSGNAKAGRTAPTSGIGIRPRVKSRRKTRSPGSAPPARNPPRRLPRNRRRLLPRPQRPRLQRRPPRLRRLPQPRWQRRRRQRSRPPSRHPRRPLSRRFPPRPDNLRNAASVRLRRTLEAGGLWRSAGFGMGAPRGRTRPGWRARKARHVGLFPSPFQQKSTRAGWRLSAGKDGKNSRRPPFTFHVT